MTLLLDFSNMFAEAQPGAPAARRALTPDDWTAASAPFAGAFDAVARAHAAGTLGFLDLPDASTLAAQSTTFAAGARGRFGDVVVLGIGGSALGPIALRTALRPSGWNALGESARSGWPRLHVLDNVDPETIAALLGRLDLTRTLFVVTSKSGGTAETMAQFLIARERVRAALGSGLDPHAHFVFVTDPEKGALRALARTHGVTALDVPPNVGGRFSVLSPVGMLPAALIGIDVAALLAGAGAMARRCATRDPAANPAGAFATLQWLADTVGGKHVQVLMPYADALRDFAAWFVQLWAESLGKARPDGRHVGPTPLAALGATDQHSQVQLFMEGPADKTVTFVAVGERPTDLQIPRASEPIPELSYLGGHTLGELIGIEQRATAGALARRGRPNMTIHLPRVDEGAIGELIMLLELATAYAGTLYGVNAFDQPGVELGKQFAYAMLGREDAAAARAEWERLPAPDPRWRV